MYCSLQRRVILLSNIHLNPFVLLNSHTDPAEPLDGTGKYPSTFSTNTSTSIAFTSLPLTASRVSVSCNRPSPKADSWSLISTAGGYTTVSDCFSRPVSSRQAENVCAYCVYSGSVSSAPSSQILVEASQTRCMASLDNYIHFPFLSHHQPIRRLTREILWPLDCWNVWHRVFHLCPSHVQSRPNVRVRGYLAFWWSQIKICPVIQDPRSWILPFISHRRLCESPWVCT